MTIKTAKPPAGATAKQFSNLKYLGITLIILAILGVSIKSLFGDSPEKRVLTATTKETTIASLVAARVQSAIALVPESPEARFHRERQFMFNCQFLQNGNANQPHTVVKEISGELGTKVFEVEIDGTNPDGWIHNLNTAIRPGPNSGIEIAIQSLNPLEPLDYNACGTGTPIWGERYGRPLLASERIEFYHERNGHRYADQHGALFAVLVDPESGTLRSREYGRTYAGFEPNQREIRLHYFNKSFEPVELDIGIHRNLFGASPNPNNPELIENFFSASGWRGKQYWRLRITIRPML